MSEKRMQPLSNPELTAAATKLSELRASLASTELEADATLVEINKARAGERLTPAERAELLLAGEPIPAPADIPALEHRLHDLRDHGRTLSEAVRLQADKVTSLRIALTRKSLPVLRAEHDAILLRQLAGALELHRARIASAQWRQAAEAAGYSISAVGELSSHHCHAPALPSLIEVLSKRGIITGAEAAKLLAEVAPSSWRPEPSSKGSAPNMQQAALLGGAAIGANVRVGR